MHSHSFCSRKQLERGEPYPGLGVGCHDMVETFSIHTCHIAGKVEMHLMPGSIALCLFQMKSEMLDTG